MGMPARHRGKPRTADDGDCSASTSQAPPAKPEPVVAGTIRQLTPGKQRLRILPGSEHTDWKALDALAHGDVPVRHGHVL